MSDVPVYMLDTNMVSLLMSRTSLCLRENIATKAEHSALSISVLVEAEILYGLRKMPEATHRREAFLALARYITVLPWDSAAARAYADLRINMAARGKSLDTIDMLIAAHAHAIGAVLVTHDKAFARAGNLLELEDWAIDI